MSPFRSCDSRSPLGCGERVQHVVSCFNALKHITSADSLRTWITSCVSGTFPEQAVSLESLASAPSGAKTPISVIISLAGVTSFKYLTVDQFFRLAEYGITFEHDTERVYVAKPLFVIKNVKQRVENLYHLLRQQNAYMAQWEDVWPENKWLWFYANRKNRLHFLQPSGCRWLGEIVWDGEDCNSVRSAPSPSSAFPVRFLSIQESIHFVQSWDHIPGTWLSWAYPEGSVQLRDRVKLHTYELVVYAIRRLGARVVGELLYYAAGLGGQTLSRLLLYCCLCAEGLSFVRRLYEIGVFAPDVKECQSRLKKVHTAMRACDSTICIDFFTRLPVDQFLYPNLLLGRIPDAGNVYAELFHRASDDQSVEPRSRRVLDEVSHLWLDYILSGLYGTRSPATIEDMILDLINHGTGGSSTRRELCDFIKSSNDLHSSGLSKLRALAVATINENVLVSRENGCHGTAITKYEPGARLRPLMPSTDADWIRWALLLQYIESDVWRLLPTCPMTWGPDELRSWVSQLQAATSAGVVLAASDFDDYNQLHTIELMGYIAERLAAYLAEGCNDAVREYILDLGKLISSGMRVSKIKVAEQVIHPRYGLWSGWRSTSFINTILNPVYNVVASPASDLKALLFMGDDSVGVCENVETAVRHLGDLERARFFAQPSKQLVSQRRTEFLRIMYRDGLLGVGSLIRSVSSGLSGDLQHPRVSFIDPQGFADWVAVLQRRGAVNTENFSNFVNRLKRRGVAVVGDGPRQHTRIIRSRTTLSRYVNRACSRFGIRQLEIRNAIFRETVDGLVPPSLDEVAPVQIAKEGMVDKDTVAVGFSKAGGYSLRFLQTYLQEAVTAVKARLCGVCSSSRTMLNTLCERFSIQELVVMSHLRGLYREIVLRSPPSWFYMYF